MESEIEIENIKIRIFRKDNYPGKPVIIFLHESLGCIELWKSFPEKLGKASECSILIYDRHGYGRSDPFKTLKRNNDYMETESDFLIRLMEKSGIENAILFGHSDGGTIALLAAAKYPDKISGVITAGAHVFVEEVTLEGIRKAAEDYKNTDLKIKLTKYHGDKTDDVFRVWAETWLSGEFRKWNIENFLCEIKCPCLIIQGENDEYGSIMQVDAITEKVKNAERFIIPGAGHSLHGETAEQVIVRSADFIKKVILKNHNVK